MQHNREPALLPQYCSREQARQPGGISFNPARDRSFVIWITLTDQSTGPFFPSTARIREARFASVENEHIRCKQMTPASFQSALAEVDFLSVAHAKRLCIKWANFFHAASHNQHAEADSSWDLDSAASIGAGACAIDLANRMSITQFVRPADIGVAADSRIVGKWRDCPYARSRVCLSGEAVQPISMHLGVVVQENEIRCRRVDSEINASREAEVRCVSQQPDVSAAFEVGKVLIDFGFGTMVINQNEAAERPILRSRLQDALKTSLRFAEAPINGDNNVHLQPCREDNFPTAG
jgi:hypothetical protein